MNYYLTVDIGGTDIKYGVIGEDLVLVYKSTVKTEGHLGGHHVINTIKKLFNELSNKYELKGIAISTTSGISDDDVVMTPSFAIKDYEGINFKEELKDLGVNISAENDVNSMALCEKELVKDHEDKKCIITMTLGTGIGGAIFINDKMHRGFKYTAGEWGKIIISKNKTYEQLASTKALVDSAKKVNPKLDNGIKVFEAYDNGDEDIIPVVHEFYNYVARGLANIIYVLNPDHIVIGGGITNRGDIFLEELKAHLKPMLWDYLANDLNLELAKKRNDAGMIGAFINYKNRYLK